MSLPPHAAPAVRRPSWRGAVTVAVWCGGLVVSTALLLALGVQPGDALLWPVLVAPLGLLGRSPVAALLLLTVGGVAVLTILHDKPYDRLVAVALAVAVDVAVGRVAAVHARWVSAVVAVLVVTAQLGLSLFDPVGGQPTLTAVVVLGVVTAWVIGNSARQRRHYAEAQREQAEARAVQAERLRIARELHDLIAHSIGVIAVQAGVGRRVIDTQPAEARNSLATIEDTSRETLAALRRILGTLRRSDPGSGAAPLDPAPGLADLDALVARTADAGVRVGLRWQGDRAALPPDIDLSAFRVIQEAVTNVIRHAGTDRCDVLIHRDPEELTIEITDEGRGGEPGPGYGIPGMRERVSLLSGDFSAGPGGTAGFRVAARIPVPRAAR